MIDSESFKKLIEDCGVWLYGTEIVHENDIAIVRVYIVSKDGITLDTCSKVSNIISPILDLEPPVRGKYMLEVSSPGIERKINSLDQMKLSVGELVKATILEDGEKIKIKGRLLSNDGESFELEDKNSKTTKKFNYDQVLKAKTYYIWN
jgi:ribosome maturation factor RimP